MSESKLEGNRRRNAAYRARWRERIREKQRAWAAKNPLTDAQKQAKREQRRRHEVANQEMTQERAMRNNLRRNYGLSAEDYNAMLESQGSRCLICGGVCTDGRRLHVDHCHETGEIRGLLCNQCNLGLGRFSDDPVLLERALRYLLGELNWIIEIPDDAEDGADVLDTLIDVHRKRLRSQLGWDEDVGAYYVLASVLSEPRGPE